jgi:hypothetical protein
LNTLLSHEPKPMSRTQKPRPLRKNALGMTSRIVYSDDYGPLYITRRPLDENRAVRFCRMIANNPRFTEAKPLRMPDGTWRAMIRPSSLESLFRRCLLASIRKMEAEGRGYEFYPRELGAYNAGETSPPYDCFNPLSGCWYEVREHRCSCPQFSFRLQHIGVSCKHQLEAQRRGLFSVVVTNRTRMAVAS